MSEFKGFTPETYTFLMELAFNNSKAFFSANKERYTKEVQQPIKELAEMLLPTMLSIDPKFNPKISSIVSRINRDTRYSKDKSPYRSNLWLAYRWPGQSLSESLCMYFEMSPEGYGYGLGMYHTNAPMMQKLRERAAVDPAGFEALIHAPCMQRYTLSGEAYQRDRFALPDVIKPYLNRKSLSFCYENPSVLPTMQPQLFDEIKSAMLELAPLYQYIVGV